MQTTLFCWFFVCKASSGCVCWMMATMVVLVKVLLHIKFDTSSVSSPLQPTPAPHDCRELSQIWLRFVFGGFRVPFSCQHQHLTWQTLHRLMPRKAKSSPLALLSTLPCPLTVHYHLRAALDRAFGSLCVHNVCIRLTPTSSCVVLSSHSSSPL